MQTLEIKLENASYPVYLGPRLLTETAVWRTHLGAGKVLVVSNEAVASRYLAGLHACLSDWDVATHIIPDGEQYKTQATWSGIIDQLVRMRARRDATIIALGGGVVGDLSGFAAASFMRGIQFIQAPTTLLAQVDASVGGKTGFNHPAGKNLVGAFHQPIAVMIDTDTLKSLPVREFRAGLSEVVKYGAIMDAALFEWLETSTDAINSRHTDALLHLIGQSVMNKARIVSADEREGGIRAILNFGHTFGHALETLTGYTDFLHGEAVAAGMVVAARLSELRGLCPSGISERIRRLLQALDLPVELPPAITAESLYEAMQLDKKAVVSGSRLILLAALGEALIDSRSSREEILAAISSCRSNEAESSQGT